MNPRGGLTLRRLQLWAGLAEFAREQEPGHEHSRLVLVRRRSLFELVWQLELGHLRRSTSRYRPKRDDEGAQDRMNDGGGRGVGCAVLAHRGRSEEMGGKRFCARKA